MKYVSYDVTEQYVARLKRAGAKVEVHTEADKGMKTLASKQPKRFSRWIRAQLGE